MRCHVVARLVRRHRFAPSRVAAVAALLGLVAALSACGDDIDSVRPVSTEIFASPSSVLIPLTDGRVVVERGAMLLVVDPREPTREPITVGAAEGIGQLCAVTTLDGAFVVLTTTGTFVLRGDSWVPSPFGEAFDGPIVRAAVLPARTAIETPELWITTASSLYRVRRGEVQRLDLAADFAAAELVVGARPEAPSLWVRLPDRVLELWTDGAGALRTARAVLPSHPSAMGGDARRTVWFVIDGRLHSLGADRQLVDRDVLVGRLLTSPLSPEIWLSDTDGKLWLNSDGALLEVLGPATLGATAALGIDGALYTVAPGASTDVVFRHAPRHDVTVGGPMDGALVVTDQSFPVQVLGDAAASIEARIDDVAVPIVPDPLSVELDAATLSDGVHTLAIDVTFTDGTLPTRVRRRFELLTTATWTGDIEPLYGDHCGTCHGAAGPANTRLDAPADWQTRIADIRTNVETGRMPLGQQPLSQRQTALIQAWELGGFRE